MSALAAFGKDMAARITTCLAAAQLGKWQVFTGPPGTPVGRTAWPSIDAVNTNVTMAGAGRVAGLAQLEGSVWFAIPSEGKAGEIDVMVPRLLAPDGFPAHWQVAPFPVGYQHLVAERGTMEEPIEVNSTPFAVVRWQFTGLVK